jgi:PAS domain S-box-containing protein
MSNLPSDPPRSFGRKPRSSELNGGANGAAVFLDLLGEERPFELPARLFEQLPFAVYVCDVDGLFLRYNRRAAELWGRSPKPGDPDERFCGSYRMYRPDGSRLPHDQCPMADVLRTGVSVREREVHIERPNGVRGIALVDIEAVKDGAGNIIGAVNCFQDVTERKRAEEHTKLLSREVDHRAKNLLALMQATVHLTQADTVEEFKATVEGRLQALSNAHTLLAESRWEGANIRSLVSDEFAPYCLEGTSRTDIVGPELVLQPQLAQAIAMVLHELTTNAIKYGALSIPSGRLRVEWSRGETHLVIRWSEADGPLVKPPQRQGFGTRVVSRVIQDLNGKLRFDWKPEGIACEIVVPVDQLARAAPEARGTGIAGSS